MPNPSHQTVRDLSLPQFDWDRPLIFMPFGRLLKLTLDSHRRQRISNHQTTFFCYSTIRRLSRGTNCVSFRPEKEAYSTTTSVGERSVTFPDFQTEWLQNKTS